MYEEKKKIRLDNIRSTGGTNSRLSIGFQLQERSHDPGVNPQGQHIYIVHQANNTHVQQRDVTPRERTVARRGRQHGRIGRCVRPDGVLCGLPD